MDEEKKTNWPVLITVLIICAALIVVYVLMD